MTDRVLIGYGTRYGSTAETAEEMAKAVQEAGVEADVVDLKKSVPPLPLHDYNLVVIGSGIRAGKWAKEPLKFIEMNLDALAKNRVAIFVVCGYAANPAKCEFAQIEFLNKIIEQYPSLAPVSTGLFPGVFDFSRYNFLMRSLVRRMLKSEMEPGEEIPDKIDLRDNERVREWITGLVR